MSSVSQRSSHSAKNQFESDDRSSIRDARQAAAQSLQDLGTSVKESAREGVDAVRERAADMVERGKSRAMEAERNLESRIQDNPLAALGIAIGAGFLLGVFFNRRA